MNDEKKLFDLAMGELEGEAKKDAAKLQADSQESKSFVDDIQDIQAQLKKELYEGPQEQLDQPRKQQVMGSVGSKGLKKFSIGFAIAASLLIASGIYMTIYSDEIKRQFGNSDASIIGGSPQHKSVHGSIQPYLGRNSSIKPPAGELVVMGGLDGMETGVDTEPSEGFHKNGVKHNTEAYDHVIDNPFYLVNKEALSTFSIDVDTASYANFSGVFGVVVEVFMGQDPVFVTDESEGFDFFGVELDLDFYVFGNGDQGAIDLRNKNFAGFFEGIDVGVVAVALVRQLFHGAIFVVAHAESKYGQKYTALGFGFDKVYQCTLIGGADVEIAIRS